MFTRTVTYVGQFAFTHVIAIFYEAGGPTAEPTTVPTMVPTSTGDRSNVIVSQLVTDNIIFIYKCSYIEWEE